jgi:hypothetical protein
MNTDDLPLFARAGAFHVAAPQSNVLPFRRSSTAVSATSSHPAGVLIGFPISRHLSVEKLAKRCAQYDPNRAAFFLRAECDKAYFRQLDRGIPEELADRNADALERAVWARMVILQRSGGDAA